MEAFLPSEIARLVFGYLEDQKCTEAARIFLETSPHLQECRTVISNGRRFSTRVNGVTLIDILEKFSAINTMIQERLSKISDCEQLKHCGDLLEQLKFLVEEPRGQRFVVNINVPSQANSQISNGSPIISSSMRKRRHSNSDRERCKRTRILSNVPQQSESVSSQTTTTEVVEATPLESLPGHTETLRLSDQSNSANEKTCDVTTSNHQVQCSTSKRNFKDVNHTPDSREKISGSGGTSTDEDQGPRSNTVKDMVDKMCDASERDEIVAVLEKCTTATSTEELLSFSCAEVQTSPYDTPESESETNDEPIENLSLLTKELLSRTELQERIAENINKAILPTDVSFKDDILNESVNGEINTSIMTELNNAIKSIVEATESDPVFEQFLDEIIGPHTETDTSPDEDGDAKPMSKLVNGSREKQPDVIPSNIDSPDPTIQEARSSNEADVTEVPLKHRLRSSSRQQSVRAEDEPEKHREHEKEQSSLEDQNAAAVLSIINANITNNKVVTERKIVDETKELTPTDEEASKGLLNFVPDVTRDNEQPVKSIPIDTQKTSNVVTLQNNEVMDARGKKSMLRRPRPAKPKRDAEGANNFVTEQEIMAMPTLIVCSKEEIGNIVATTAPYPSVRSITASTNSRFIPIAPKDASRTIETPETLYLRTVNVAQKVPTSFSSILATTSRNPVINPTVPQTCQKISTKENDKLKNVPQQPADTVGSTSQAQVTVPEVVDTNKQLVELESITLYGNENSAKTLLDSASMPTINVEENISLSGTGLSPYLRFHCNKSNQNHSLSDIDVAPLTENTKISTQVKNNMVSDLQQQQQHPSGSKTECEIINKRTPRSLLKSRSKNHRLSLSTPRRRSNHIRALDFNTPTKVASVPRPVSDNEAGNFSPRSAKHTKSVRRTSLFKSPPFTSSGGGASAHKSKSPLKLCRSSKVPVATRSPVPKLMGDWEKHNGVGVIIGDVSPQRNTELSENKDQVKSKSLKDSWDSDLRKALQFTRVDNSEVSKIKKKEIKDKTNSSVKKDKSNSRSLKSKVNKKSCNKNDNLAKDGDAIEERTSSNEETRSKPGSVETTPLDEQSAVSSDTKKDVNVQMISDISQTRNVNQSENICEPKTVCKTTVNTNGNPTTEKKSVKKYAQLKTIRTNLTKFNSERKHEFSGNLDTFQSSEFTRTSIDVTQHILQMPNVMDLETPRKFDNISGIPPTPRLLSPSSNMVTPFIKVSDDSSKMRSFISTPEFPTTPCITLTPKHAEENSNTKKDGFVSCSPYYRPSNEQQAISTEKAIKLKQGNFAQKSVTLSPTPSTKPCVSHGIIGATNSFQTCVSAKLEITQFEVIKENLPKEEAVKELKISSNSKDSTCLGKSSQSLKELTTSEFEAVNRLGASTNEVKYMFNSEDSRDSDSSSSSNSSSSTTSSSSSSSASTSSNSTSSSEEYSAGKKSKRLPNKIYTDTSNDSMQKNVLGRKYLRDNANLQNILLKPTSKTLCSNQVLDNADLEKEIEVTPIAKSESSPVKVFSITKSDEELKSCVKETPAKDETLLNEADISETPSSSKAGVESLTNLSSKISAFINSADEKQKSSPVLEAEHSKGIKARYKTTTSKNSVTTSSCLKPPCATGSAIDEKLVSQLEAKRQRIIAKFREIPKSSSTRGKSQQRRGMIRTKSTLAALKRNNQPRSNPSKRPRNEGKELQKGNVEESNNNNTMKAKRPDAKLKTNTLKVVRKNSNAEKLNCLKNSTNHEIPKKISVPEISASSCNSKREDDVGVVEKDVQITGKSQETHDHEVRVISCEEGARSIDTEDKPQIPAIMQEHLSESKNNTEKNSSANKVDVTECDAIPKVCEKDVTGKESSLQENSSSRTGKEDQANEAEKLSKSREYGNSIGKMKCIPKSKVDQVKRDLFSDEENDQRTINSTADSTDQKSVQQVSNVKSNLNVIDAPKTIEKVEVEKQKDLCVLQCLQLVPACKTDQIAEEVENEGETAEKSQFNTTTSKSVEYHFIYNDSTSVRKRRRRYGSHELEFQVNIALNDQNAKEYVKVMTATDYEEIYDVQPKSRKRAASKRVPANNLKIRDTNDATCSANPFSLNDICTKPLATSSPVDKTVLSKVKKINPKISAASNKNGDAQDKKKPKIEKSHESDKDNPPGKSRKRKTSETKDTKQIEKRQQTADPQTLLNNLDLDKFLTSVHGPA